MKYYLYSLLFLLLFLFSMPLLSQEQPASAAADVSQAAVVEQKIAADGSADTTEIVENDIKENLSNESAENNDEFADAIKEEEEAEAAQSAAARGNSLYGTVKQGGPLMIFLVLLGIISLTIIIERIIFYSRNRIWKSDEVDRVMAEAVEKSPAHYREDLEDDLRAFYQIYSNGVERGLALLSGIGNVAPIMGFLGTVIGMIQAFASIAAATTVNAKVVAVGIQIALVTTAGGLVVAAPTLAFYYFFIHVLQNRYARVEELIAEACEKRPRLSDRLCQED
jgi:biopolymer transport protein ExbB